MTNKFNYFHCMLIKQFRKLQIPFGISTWTTILSFTFIINILVRNINQLKQISLEDFSSYLFLTSLCIAIFSLFINAMAWRSLLYWMGCTKPQLEDIISLYIRTNLYKYLPGGVWHFVARLKSLRTKLNPRDSVKGVILEPLLMLSAAMLFAPLGNIIKAFSFILFLPSILFLTNFRDFILDFIKRIKFDRLDIFNSTFVDFEDLKTRAPHPLKPFLIETLFILFRFISLLLCFSAFSLDFQGLIFKLLGAFSIAWSIGLIVPAAPGGVGVFESALIFQVGNYFPPVILLFTLVSYRVIISLADLLAPSVLSLSRIINLSQKFNSH